MGRADIGSKRLLETEAETWVRWLLDDPSLRVEATLSGEFQFVLRQNDVLLRVQGKRGPFLMLAESQLHFDPTMPRRMRAYAALAEEKYARPVYPIVFYWLPPQGRRALVGHYHSEFMGLVAHQDFRVVPAWEIDAREVLSREIMALVPFVPLMQGADEEVVREGVSLLRKRDMGEEAEVVLGLFASFVMTPEQVCRIVRWNMVVLRESPWYQEIVQEGLQQGLQQGVLEGQREAILYFLRARFDLSMTAADEVGKQLREIEDPALLRSLAEKAARAESLQAFLAALNGDEIAA
ncbi:MAG TPA: hypothetical protein EYH31_10105 [Anaerolineae bacterium]|nr:hypothetical protein [Anaerolineae bacterium]